MTQTYRKSKFEKIDDPINYIGKYVHVNNKPNSKAYLLVDTDGYTHTLRTTSFYKKNRIMFKAYGRCLKKTHKIMNEELNNDT
jgi:hypothetical protein